MDNKFRQLTDKLFERIYDCLGEEADVEYFVRFKGNDAPWIDMHVFPMTDNEYPIAFDLGQLLKVFDKDGALLDSQVRLFPEPHIFLVGQLEWTLIQVTFHSQKPAFASYGSASPVSNGSAKDETRG